MRQAELCSIVLGVAVILAGCTKAERDAQTTGNSPGATTDWPLTIDASGCDDAAILFYLDIDHVQDLLPPGFTATDAAEFYGSPAGSGKGMISVPTIDCSHSSFEGDRIAWTGVYIIVDPPLLEGADVERPARDEAYLAAFYTDSVRLQTRLSEVGHDIVASVLESSVPDPPQSGVMKVNIADSDGEVARFTAYAPGYQTLGAGHANVWQGANEGLLHARIDFASRDASAGTTISCSIREDSQMHAILGFTDCTGQTALAAAARDDPYRLEWTHFSGATVAGADE